MKNQAFIQKSSAEKQRHLAGVLKAAAKGAIDEKMVGWILSVVYIHRQYTVSVFSDSRLFHGAIKTRADSGNLSVVQIESGNGASAAVIMPMRKNDPGKEKWVILLYTPEYHAQKGDKNAQKLQRTVCIRGHNDTVDARHNLPHHQAMAAGASGSVGNSSRSAQVIVCLRAEKT